MAKASLFWHSDSECSAPAASRVSEVSTVTGNSGAVCPLGKILSNAHQQEVDLFTEASRFISHVFFLISCNVAVDVLIMHINV